MYSNIYGLREAEQARVRLGDMKKLQEAEEPLLRNMQLNNAKL